METQPHFKELLKLLEKHSAEYVIVGGYAVAFYGYPRFTKDIDIFFRSSKDNITRIRKALIEFGFAENDLPESIFEEPGNIIQFGVSPLRVDIINEIDGVSFDEAIANSVRGRYGDIDVSFIGRIELIKNKRASGRDQDLVDAKRLEKNLQQ
jgi:hypothetical protein